MCVVLYTISTEISIQMFYVVNISRVIILFKLNLHNLRININYANEIRYNDNFV